MLDSPFKSALIEKSPGGLRATLNNWRAVSTTLRHLGMPIPKNGAQFLLATDGVLLLSSRFGIVARIERRDVAPPMDWPGCPEIERVNNNPWVLRPLASFITEDFLVEICPGIHPIQNYEEKSAVCAGLKKTGLFFWDIQDANIGRLPVKTSTFKNGIPVVLDRLAVAGFTKGLDAIKQSLRQMDTNRDPQNILYAPLRKALKAAWPEDKARPAPKAMRDFWSLCAAFKSAGKLVAGWNTSTPAPESPKTVGAREAARAYDRLWKGFLP